MICKQARGVPQMRMTDPRLAATQPESGLVTLNGDPGHKCYPMLLLLLSDQELNTRNTDETVESRTGPKDLEQKYEDMN